ALGIAQGEWAQPARFAAYLAVAALASLCKVRLPRMTGTISLNFVLLIVAVVDLPFSEVVLISAVAGVAQSLWKPRKRQQPVQGVFNAACLVVSASLAWAACRWLAAAGSAEPGLLLLAPVTLVLYVCNTAMVAGVLCLVEGRPLTGIWNRCNFWALPYYLVGTTASGLMIATGRVAGCRLRCWCCRP
ncbi:MAG: hypothetical protein HYR60_16275, partial [Acidobacteria bacterium]|nr:hypothetical protein [Acidobacteriota bacterium]